MNGRLKRLLGVIVIASTLFFNQLKAEPVSANEQFIEDNNSGDVIVLLETIYEKIANGDAYINVSSDDKLDIRPNIDISIPMQFSGNNSVKVEIDYQQNTNIGKSIAEYAKGLVGSSYSYGSTGNGSFDCSGFVFHVYKNFGISLPRTSQSQAYLGERVSKSELQPGDLVFSNTYSPLSHVGIYIGEGKFVHAANYRSGVTISGINDSYYGSRYAWATRVY